MYPVVTCCGLFLSDLLLFQRYLVDGHGTERPGCHHQEALLGSVVCPPDDTAKTSQDGRAPCLRGGHMHGEVLLLVSGLLFSVIT